MDVQLLTFILRMCPSCLMMSISCKTCWFSAALLIILSQIWLGTAIIFSSSFTCWLGSCGRFVGIYKCTHTHTHREREREYVPSVLRPCVQLLHILCEPTERGGAALKRCVLLFVPHKHAPLHDEVEDHKLFQ